MASEQAESWAQQRLKAREEEETEDWQSKLANWKDRRRQQMPRKSIDAGTPPHAGHTAGASPEHQRIINAAHNSPEKGSSQIVPQKVCETQGMFRKTTTEGLPSPKLAQQQRSKPQPPPKPYPKPQPKQQQPQPIQRVQNPADHPPIANRAEENGRKEEPVYGRSRSAREWGTVWQQGRWEESASDNTPQNTYGSSPPQCSPTVRDTQEGRSNGNYVHSGRSYVYGNDMPDSERGCVTETSYASTCHSTAYNNARDNSWKPDNDGTEYYGHRSGYGASSGSRAAETRNDAFLGDYNCNAYDHTVTTSTSLLSEFSCEAVPREAPRLGDNKWGGRTSQPPKQEDSRPLQQVPETPDDLPLSVSGRQRCSHCRKALGHGAAMVIESLGLLYHLECFRCCVCSAPLGNGRRGTDVRVRNTKLHCCNCYSNDEAGLQLSRV
ncbi:probable serine/threonine-protein kinase samkC isoform X2 [Ornithodoros turicata]